ncbi:MAG: virion core protein (lumpy skin disease virus)-like protein [Bacteroidetes bacterium]|nr:MAG: virion core protein (lumpy skin disease virus)-like protein [Bacteroidota bacterium]
MGLFDSIRGEFIDIIEWTDSSNDTMVWRFPRHDNEIKNNAKLTVRESQQAVFINEGKLADVFKPGMHNLTTQNLPILSTLKGWKYGFDSPFKAEVYFVNTKQFTNLKWGTKNPVMLRDAEFGPIRIRTFGTYAMRVSDAGKFLKEVAGTDGHFTTEEITDQLRNIVVTRSTDAIAGSKIPVLDMASNLDEFSKFILEKIKGEFDEYGIELTKLLVENISLPPNVEEMLDKRSSMGIVGNLGAFSQFQAANSMEAAANNPNGGGMAGAGMGMGMGMAMGNQMGNMFQPNQFNPQTGLTGGNQNTPPPPPPVVQYFTAVNGTQSGPFTEPVLQQMAQAGQLTPQTLVWKNGMANWLPAGQVPELAALFMNTPPPVPPPVP